MTKSHARKMLCALSVFVFIGLSPILPAAISATDPNTTGSAKVVNVDASNFPFVYLDVLIRQGQLLVTDFGVSGLKIYEGQPEVLQPKFVGLTPPIAKTSGERPLLDMVFLVDDSGSMRPYQLAIKNNIKAFADDMIASGIDVRFAIVRFGQRDGDYNSPTYEYDWTKDGWPEFMNNGQWITDINQFQSIIDSFQAIGGTEPSIHAIKMAAEQLSFRPGSNRSFVLVTDEASNSAIDPNSYDPNAIDWNDPNSYYFLYGYDTSEDLEAATQACLAKNIVVNSIVPYDKSEPYDENDAPLINEFYIDPNTSITARTGGIVSDLVDNYDKIFMSIGKTVTDKFLFKLKYYAINNVADGTTRNGRVSVLGDTKSGAFSYVANPVPDFAFPDDLNFELSKGVTANHNLDLSFTTQGTANPWSITMYVRTRDPNVSIDPNDPNDPNTVPPFTAYPCHSEGDRGWTVSIPGPAVGSYGFDYYLSAEIDDKTTITFPAKDALTDPYTVNVTANGGFVHIPNSIIVAGANLDLYIGVQSWGPDIQKAVLHYRAAGGPVWQDPIDLTATSTPSGYKVMFTGTIPGENIATDGLDYYFELTGANCRYLIGDTRSPYRVPSLESWVVPEQMNRVHTGIKTALTAGVEALAGGISELRRNSTTAASTTQSVDLAYEVTQFAFTSGTSMESFKNLKNASPAFQQFARSFAAGIRNADAALKNSKYLNVFKNKPRVNVSGPTTLLMVQNSLRDMFAQAAGLDDLLYQSAPNAAKWFSTWMLKYLEVPDQNNTKIAGISTLLNALESDYLTASDAFSKLYVNPYTYGPLLAYLKYQALAAELSTTTSSSALLLDYETTTPRFFRNELQIGGARATQTALTATADELGNSGTLKWIAAGTKGMIMGNQMAGLAFTTDPDSPLCFLHGAFWTGQVPAAAGGYCADAGALRIEEKIAVSVMLAQQAFVEDLVRLSQMHYDTFSRGVSGVVSSPSISPLMNQANQLCLSLGSLQTTILGAGTTEDKVKVRFSLQITNNGGTAAPVQLSVKVYPVLAALGISDDVPLGVFGDGKVTTIGSSQTTTLFFDTELPRCSTFGALAFAATGQVLFGPQIQATASTLFVAETGALAATLSGLVTPKAFSASPLYMSQGQVYTATYTPAGNNALLVLRYLEGTVDLHIYDAAGDHFGYNYDTGKFDEEITGLKFIANSGRKTIVGLSGLKGKALTIKLYARNTVAPVLIDLSGIEYADAVPAVFTCIPSRIAFDSDEAGVVQADKSVKFEQTINVREIGLSQATNISLTSVALTDSSTGLSIPANKMEVSLADTSLAAGESINGTVRITVAPTLAPGTYTGQLLIQGTSQTYSVAVSLRWAPKQLTLNVSGQGQIVQTGGYYKLGTQMTLQAQAADGWKFDRWEGDYQGSTNPATITMDTNKVITAVFIANEQTPEYTLTVHTLDENGTVAPATGTYTAGTVANITATPKNGYRVKAWTGTSNDASTQNTNSVTMTCDKTVTVSFEQIPNQYQLTTTVLNGHGTCAPTNQTFIAGQTATVVASPDIGYRVKQWTGTDNDASVALTNTVTMNSNKTVTVEFEAGASDQYQLSVSVVGDHGTVTPTAGVYFSGSKVVLSATPEAGYSVKRWTGTNNDLSLARTNTVTMNGNKTVTVEFAPYCKLTTTVVGGHGTIWPREGSFPQGLVVGLTASPESGYKVKTWTGTTKDSSTSVTNTVVMDADKTVTLEFQPIEESPSSGQTSNNNGTSDNTNTTGDSTSNGDTNTGNILTSGPCGSTGGMLVGIIMLAGIALTITKPD